MAYHGFTLIPTFQVPPLLERLLNSKHFAETMRDITVELSVSFDVSSLFTNVPIGEGLREPHSHQIG